MSVALFRGLPMTSMGLLFLAVLSFIVSVALIFDTEIEPCVRYNDVVEWSISLAKPRQPYPDHHCCSTGHCTRSQTADCLQASDLDYSLPTGFAEGCFPVSIHEAEEHNLTYLPR